MGRAMGARAFHPDEPQNHVAVALAQPPRGAPSFRGKAARTTSYPPRKPCGSAASDAGG
jgi:hypothetical protein